MVGFLNAKTSILILSFYSLSNIFKILAILFGTVEPFFENASSELQQHYLDKMPNIVIWWQPSTSRINFERAENLNNPANQVFKDALVELVENIRCDRAIDVDIR